MVEPHINKDNVMLVDVQYANAKRKEGINDYLYLIYKNLDTNEKFLKCIEEPKMTFYYEKEEFRDHDYNKIFTELDKTFPITTKYRNIINAIAEVEGPDGKEKLKEIYDTKQYERLKEILADPYVFGADFDIRVWYRYHWLKNFNNDRVKNISKGFADIEVDTFESVGMPDPNYNPIDLVTVIDGDNKAVYTFSLIGVECQERDINFMTKQSQIDHEMFRRELYKKRLEQQVYWTSHVDELYEEIHKFFDENYPGFTYKIYFYKNELKMLHHLFQLINKLNKDMLAFWNISFDIPYIINRLEALGDNPEEVICPDTIPNKAIFFKKDKFHFEIKNKTDFFRCTSPTVYLDQMINYAAIRKGGSELRSNRLTYIAKKEIGDEKLDYSEDGNIKTLSYHNFLKYILYNIKDVLLQWGIENVTQDMETVYVYSYENITPYEDVFKQIVTLRDCSYLYYMDQNVIPGTNINSLFYEYGKEKKASKEITDDEESDDEDDSSFEGALVGDPRLIEKFGIELFGKQTDNIFLKSIDLDMSAFYPYTIIVNNIIASALVFKVIIDAGLFDVRGGKFKFNGYTIEQSLPDAKDSFSDDVAKEFGDNLQSRNYLQTGYKWFNFPNVNDVYERMKKKYD